MRAAEQRLKALARLALAVRALVRQQRLQEGPARKQVTGSQTGAQAGTGAEARAATGAARHGWGSAAGMQVMRLRLR